MHPLTKTKPKVALVQKQTKKPIDPVELVERSLEDLRAGRIKRVA